MKFYLKIKQLAIFSVLVALSSACSPSLTTPQKSTATKPPLQQPATKKTTPHSLALNPYIQPDNKFGSSIPEESTPDIKKNTFSDNLEKTLKSKSEKNYSISGDVYLNDTELGSAPALEKLDGGYIDIEVKFK